jgi:hypothetical protein
LNVFHLVLYACIFILTNVTLIGAKATITPGTKIICTTHS